jgi:ABC-2 type transport system permease protein
MSLYRLTKFEIKKLFWHKTAHAGIIIALLVCILYCVLNYFNRPVEGYSGVVIITDNINFQNSILTLPLIAILLAVHSVSEEFSTGTLRTLLTKPVKRENVVASKFLAILVYMCCISYAIFVISFLFGLRWGYPEDFAFIIPKLLVIYFVYVLGNVVLVAFTFAVASLNINPTLTALIAVGFHIVLLILGLFSSVQTYTFFHHATNLIKLLTGMIIDWKSVYQSLAVILVYILGLLLIASTLWERRDVSV